MIQWGAQRLADAAGARLCGPDVEQGPTRVVIDSREVRAGDLFVALPGANTDGARFVQAALDAGAWGALVSSDVPLPSGGTVLLAADPLAALQTLARQWRRALGTRVVAVTGSTGKTSTKDILASLLGPNTVATPRNLNTEIGLPLAILGAPMGTQQLVLELAMRGPGQIAELVAICEPQVGIIVNIGPAHLELLGSMEAIAAAKAELIAGLSPGACAVIPATEPLLTPHLREDIDVVRFGPGGDVTLVTQVDDVVEIDVRGERVMLAPNFASAHQLGNLLAAVAAARALDIPVGGRLDVTFSGLRGEHLHLRGGVTVINDCYNANPMSMHAALNDLAAAAPGRRVAVLGDMLELGPAEEQFHRELGEQAQQAGVELLITVGDRAQWAGAAFAGEHHHAPEASDAARLLEGLMRDGDTVLVKGSRGVGLELVAGSLS